MFETDRSQGYLSVNIKRFLFSAQTLCGPFTIKTVRVYSGRCMQHSNCCVLRVTGIVGPTHAVKACVYVDWRYSSTHS